MKKKTSFKEQRFSLLVCDIEIEDRVLNLSTRLYRFKGAKEESTVQKFYLCSKTDLHMPTLIHVSQLSSIPGLEDVTVEVSPLNVTAVTNGSHSETTSEQTQVSTRVARDAGHLG